MLILNIIPMQARSRAGADINTAGNIENIYQSGVLGVERVHGGPLGAHVLGLAGVRVLDRPLVLHEVPVEGRLRARPTIDAPDVVGRAGNHVVLHEVEGCGAGQGALGAVLVQGTVELVLVVEDGLVLGSLLVSAFVVDGDVSAEHVARLIASSVETFTKFTVPAQVDLVVDVVGGVWQYFQAFLS